MKRFVRISLTAITVLLVCAMPIQADHFRGGGWGWGPALGLGLGFGLGVLANPYPYYPYPYYRYYYPPTVVQQPGPEIYVQPAPQQPVEPGYWYFCQNPEGYYPYVKQCPNGWMKVVPSPPPPQR